jgi:hypothetical protein
LHTGTLDSLSFITALPPLPSGEYRVYAALKPTHAAARTSVRSATLPGEMRRWRPGSPLDVTYTGAGVGTPFRFEDGSTLARLGVLDAIVAGTPTVLRFSFRGTAGTPAPLDDFDGSVARAIVAHADGSGFALLDQPVAGSPRAVPGTMAFTHTFTSAGKHRLWVQLRTRGKFRSAAFDLTIGGTTR